MKAHKILVGFVDSLIGYWDQNRKKAEKKHADRGDRIGWESLGGEKFSVRFEKDSPFEDGELELVSDSGGSIAEQEVKKDATLNVPYPYTVTKLSTAFAADPEIIIDQ